MPRLGVLSKLYVNGGGIYAAPNWLEVALISELQNNATWNQGESSVRRGRAVTQEQTNLVLGLTGTVRKEMTNLAYLALHASFIAATPIDIMVLDGRRTVNGVNGWRYWARVFNWSEDQSLGTVIYKAYDIIPTAWPEPGLDSQGHDLEGERPKQVNVIGGSLVFTDIGAE